MAKHIIFFNILFYKFVYVESEFCGPFNFVCATNARSICSPFRCLFAHNDDGHSLNHITLLIRL